VNGEDRRTWTDPIGLMVVEPRCTGACQVELTYDGGWEMLLARIISWLTLVGGVVWIVKRGRLQIR
jgi:hypothetical protein